MGEVSSEFPSSYDGMKGLMLTVLGDNYTLKDKVLQLNREIASRNATIAKRDQQIREMKKAGSLDESELNTFLTETLEDRYPRDRLTWQRKEINNLHRVIKELKIEIEKKDFDR